MAEFETYVARADARVAEALAQTASPFSIEVRFLGGLTKKQREAFKTAADRWARVIVGDLPSMEVDGEVIDDLLILAQGQNIDGPGRVLGQAGPTRLRPRGTARTALLPVKGEMTFDSADLKKMETGGTLTDVITHEMGHVLGIGTIWPLKRLVRNAGTDDPGFIGKGALAEYVALRGNRPGRPSGVPVENTGGRGTAGAHWRETVFRNELMSGFIADPGNPLSRMTAASLGDLGYTVDVDAAEPYVIPDLMALAERGLLQSHVAPIDDGVMLGFIPTVLPEDAVR